jgi:hypothetical protein
MMRRLFVSLDRDFCVRRYLCPLERRKWVLAMAHGVGSWTFLLFLSRDHWLRGSRNNDNDFMNETCNVAGSSKFQTLGSVNPECCTEQLSAVVLGQKRQSRCARKSRKTTKSLMRCEEGTMKTEWEASPPSFLSIIVHGAEGKTRLRI